MHSWHGIGGTTAILWMAVYGCDGSCFCRYPVVDFG